MPSATQDIEEEVGEEVKSADRTMSLRRKLVREMHSWMDDSLDEGLYARVRQAREMTVAANDPFERRRLERSGISDIVKRAIAYKGSA